MTHQALLQRKVPSSFSPHLPVNRKKDTRYIKLITNQLKIKLVIFNFFSPASGYLFFFFAINELTAFFFNIMNNIFCYEG